MNKTKRIAYVIGVGNQDYGYGNWMQIDRFTNDIREANFCIGLGGSDVSPSFYNMPDSGLCHSVYSVDIQEYKDYKKAIELKKKIVGICKGSQWLSVLAGGKLFQHIDHDYIHKIKTFDGKELLTNSLHHQMSDLEELAENSDYKLLAWSESLSNFHIDGNSDDRKCSKEPEAILFPKINGLGFQMHPEMIFKSAGKNHPFINWSREILNKFLDNKL